MSGTETTVVTRTFEWNTSTFGAEEVNWLLGVGAGAGPGPGSGVGIGMGVGDGPGTAVSPLEETAEPAALVAVTEARRYLPSSACWTAYESPVAPGIAAQLAGSLVEHRSQGTGVMPFSLGLHPYFAVSALDAVNLEGLPET